jgi:hypothetical protein
MLLKNSIALKKIQVKKHLVKKIEVSKVETGTAFIISCCPTIRMKAAIEISSIFGTSANVTLTLTPLSL